MGAPGGELTRSMVLWCPDWPIRAAALQHPELAEEAGEETELALVEKGLVFACSPAARRAGVRRGLRVREAQARCPQLLVLPYDASVDARGFEPVLAAIEQNAPGVQPIRPGMLALRARGPARYYGGERQAAEVLLGVLAQAGAPDARIGIADGPFAAEQAARAAGREAGSAGSDPVLVVPAGGSPAFLGGLPVEAISDPAFTRLCLRLGLSTLGALAGFGEEELATRFGATGLRVHALVTGRDLAVVVPRAPQRSLERAVSFEPGLDRVDQIAFAVRQTADEVIAALTAARLVCTAVTVTVEAEAAGAGAAVGASRLEASTRTWLHPRWFTAVDLVDRVRWQLQGAGAGLSAPVARVTLTPQAVDAAHHHEEGLWGDAPDERVHHALSRVQSMLGHDAVVTAAVGGGRMLEERQQLVPWGDRPAAGLREKAAQPWPGALPDPLPGTVFLPRVPVAVLGEDGASVAVDERGVVAPEPALFASDAELRSGSGAGGGVGAGARPGADAARVLRTARPITAWAGPWTVDQRWWDASAARISHRFSVVDADGIAWLLVLGDAGWQAEARYD